MVYFVFIMAAGISMYLGFLYGFQIGVLYTSKSLQASLKKVLTLDEYEALNNKMLDYIDNTNKKS